MFRTNKEIEDARYVIGVDTAIGGDSHVVTKHVKGKDVEVISIKSSNTTEAITKIKKSVEKKDIYDE